ncbi:DNA polymerase IV [Fulvimarina pelagi HTCC2506]|uniref:DNA polymerase IV n=2 Tax=Fulvimarina pelagi TaxID=217511 RepID=Q0FZ77_9HYPH|nr:DNA polymerase IV [Fulvimarina pelagi]EAU40401.1 DNA polymerase IV [Fulvimarina pelagi HTCC2506]BAT31436.1 DNA polymerase IV [Fulvimarina pelagi]
MTAPTAAFSVCRDCHRIGGENRHRCAACGSPRVVAHNELGSLSLAHLDCDAFYASIEKRDDPSLAQKPVIVGGGTRGVVTTACYIARIRGVRSAMPMFKALKLCPEATVIRPNMEKYAGVGREIRQMMRDLTPLVQPVSIDEAFMDLKGTERLHGEPSSVTLTRLAARIEYEIGVSVSIGLSHNKFLAKMASDLEKPRGFSVIGRAETRDYLRAKPISAIWGVGDAMAAKLKADGLTMISQLQDMDDTDFIRRYGAMGLRLSKLAHGIDDRSVEPDGEAKSISAETTFNCDLHRADDLVPVLRRLCEKVSGRLKATDLAATGITLRLKTSDFRLRTRQRKLQDPTRLADRIFAAGRSLLEHELDGTRFRLIGIGCSGFAPAASADPDDLVDPGFAKRAKAEAALDSLRNRFGQKAIETGYTYGAPSPKSEPRRP